MKICIFGAGSLGSALGGILAREHDVTLIARRENVLSVRAIGLRLFGDVRFTAKVAAFETVMDVDSPDLLLITTKAYDTKEAIDECRSWAARDTLVLTLQNGLGNLEQLRKWKGAKAFGGTISMGAAMIAPGVVKVSGLGQTVIGSDLDPPSACRIREAFAASGLPSSVEKDVFGHIWAKAVVNACINPLTAILGVTNGRLLESKVMSRLMADVSRECELIASSNHIKLPYRSMIVRARKVAKDTSKNTSSMLQDVRRGRRTEVSQINGAFRDFGEKRGVPTPLNSTMAAMVETMEKG